MRRVRAGQPDGVGGGAQVAADQREVRGLDGDVGAGAHGQAEVGLRERRRVVDPVADHGDDRALVLQPLDDVDLVGGQHLGDDVARSIPTWRATACGGAAVVAGQQQRTQAERPQLCDGILRGVLHRVGDDHDAAHPSVPPDHTGSGRRLRRRWRRPPSPGVGMAHSVPSQRARPATTARPSTTP